MISKHKWLQDIEISKLLSLSNLNEMLGKIYFYSYIFSKGPMGYESYKNKEI